MVKAAQGLSVRNLLKLVYSGLFHGETRNMRFPQHGFSLVVYDDGAPHHPTRYVFNYQRGKLVEVGGVTWLLSRGEGGKYGAAGLDSDIIAIPTDNPQDIEKCLEFGNSLVIGQTDGRFKVQPKYNAFREPFEKMILGLDMRKFTAQRREVDGRDGCLDADTLSGPAVRQPFTYRPGIILVLRRGLEEMLRNADPEDFSFENSWLTEKRK